MLFVFMQAQQQPLHFWQVASLETILKVLSEQLAFCSYSLFAIICKVVTLKMVLSLEQ